MEDITDADYMFGKRVCKAFETKNIYEYHDFYLKSNTLLLVNVFKNVRKICLKFYLDLVKFLSALGLALRVALKKNEQKNKIINCCWYAVND